MDQSVNSVVCDAQESDWLDISYAERNYVSPQKHKKTAKKPLAKGLKVLMIAIACVALLGVALLVDGDFQRDVFATVKSAYSQVLSVFVEPTPTNNAITLPANVNLVDSADGVSTFGGGKATLSFTSGVVTSIGENTVTVAIDEDTTITYTGLVSIFVEQGDSVEVNWLLGKYDGTFTAVIAEKGLVVKQVVASETQLSWEV